jgi:NADH:ubiquinone oxidoreductase subunit 6 (subunit J)
MLRRLEILIVQKPMDNIRIIHAENIFSWSNLFNLIAIIGFVTANNILYSRPPLIFIFVIGMCIFFLFNAVFLGLSILMVYIGAIATLFLFTILMVDLYTHIEQKFDSEKLFSIITICCTLLIIHYNFYATFSSDSINNYYCFSISLPKLETPFDLVQDNYWFELDFPSYDLLQLEDWFMKNYSSFNQIYYVLEHAEYDSSSHQDVWYSFYSSPRENTGVFVHDKHNLQSLVISTDIQRIGKTFYTYFCIPFILCALSLFVAIIGILIASEYSPVRNKAQHIPMVMDRKQIIAEQIRKLYMIERTRPPGPLTRALRIIPSK